jgi:hypothetical protein
VNKLIVEWCEMHTYMVTKRGIAIPLNMRKIDAPATVERQRKTRSESPVGVEGLMCNPD